MKKIFLKVLFGNSNKIEERSYIWNTIAGVINAFHAVILLMVVTRVTGLEEAGILTIAFAVSKLMVTIGKFGVRNYQVTDIKKEYDFYSYLKARLVTVLGMLLASICYCLYSYLVLDSSVYKAGVILMICLIYAVESIEDVFWGEYQKAGRLDVGAIIGSIRWFVTILIFCIGLVIMHNLLIATLISFFAALATDILLIYISYGELNIVYKESNSLNWLSILKKCAPLFAGAFFMIYLTNSPKYAIEACLSDEIQACYGFVSMPVFVIELLNNFIYQPKLVKIARSWENKKLAEFKRYLIVQCCALILITGICIVGAYWLGIPVLSLMYNTDLSEYKLVLIVVLIGGGFLALTGFFAVLLTVMRKQNWMMYGYIVVSILAIVTMNTGVSKYGVLGGAILFDILIFILTILLLAFVLIGYNCRKKS